MAKVVSRGDINISIEDVTTASRLQGSDEWHLADDGKIFLLIKVSSENTGEKVRDTPSQFRLIINGEQYNAHVDGGYLTPGPSTLKRPIEGYYNPGDEIYPDVSKSGWILSEVPENIDSFKFAWEYPGENFSDDDNEVITWSLTADPGEASQPSIEEIRGPSEVEVGKQATYEIVAKNSGGREVTITKELSFVAPSESHPYNADTVSITIPGNSTREKEVKKTFKGVSKTSLLVGDKRKVINVFPQQLSWGETVEAPDGYQAQMSDFALSDRVEYISNGEREVESAPSGKQWAVIRFYESTDTLGSPTLSTENSQYTPETLTWYSDPTMKWPVESGAGRGEILVYEVPSDLAREDIAAVITHSVSWEYNDMIVYWTSGE